MPTRRHILAATAAILAAPGPVCAAGYTAFGPPEDVVLTGYAGDAMEPFLSRDGQILFFNNRNEPAEQTDIFWSERVDDTHFKFRGKVDGLNADGALDGVAALTANNEMFFVSTGTYGTSFSTLYRARFANGKAEMPELVKGVSRDLPGWVNFDVEISADGNTLYTVDSWFGAKGFPQSADFILARRNGDAFVRDPDSARILAKVNTSALEYAAGISADECELFFTRVAAITPTAEPAIWRAARKSKTEPFDEPQRIAAITGFAEAPTLSPDGKSLYFHQRVDGRFAIRRVVR